MYDERMDGCDQNITRLRTIGEDTKYVNTPKGHT